MSDFELAFEKLLKNEGGYVNDPDDKGGETKYGISKRSYPDVNIASLTKDKAKKIYKKDYWDNMRLTEINRQLLANKIFDIGVNIGAKKIIKILQKSVNYTKIEKLIIDGIIGDKTIRACNCVIGERFNEELLNRFIELIADYYLSIGNDKYIKGWLNRAYG